MESGNGIDPDDGHECHGEPDDDDDLYGYGEQWNVFGNKYSPGYSESFTCNYGECESIDDLSGPEQYVNG